MLGFYNSTKLHKCRLGWNWDADEFKKQDPINKNRILSRNMEYLKKSSKKNLKAFQNIVIIFKINSIDSRFFIFICWACRICSHSYLILCAIIAVLSTRIFQHLDLGIEWVLRCKAMKLESLRCIINLLERVVVVRST